jgi:3-oxoacyl-[acyl-carrier protein] reductase
MVSRVTIGEESSVDLGLRDRTVLVTGGSSNIGAATAEAFGREGARVSLTYRTGRQAAEKVAAAVEQAGGQAHVVPFDLADAGGPARLVGAVTERWGGLDVLVNNAVRWADAPRAFGADAGWEAMVDANLTAHLRMLRAALPALRESDGGRIVNVSTSLVERGMAGSVAYTAAKAGLSGASRSLAWEVGRNGVLVNVVMPGWVIDGKDVEIPRALLEEQSARLPTGALPSCRHVADAVVFLCSQANRSITGETLHVTGGQS